MPLRLDEIAEVMELARRIAKEEIRYAKASEFWAKAETIKPIEAKAKVETAAEKRQKEE